MLTTEVDAMLRAGEFWLGVVLGIMGLFLFVLGAWVKVNIRGRSLNRWHRRALMAQGVFTFALAVHLMLQPLDLRLPFRTAIEWPLLFVGLTAIGIMLYALIRYSGEADPTIRGGGSNGFRRG
jgi:hypothetical protein